MASETSSYASSCPQSSEPPKELLELLSVLNKQQLQQQQQLPQQQHGHNSNMNVEDDAEDLGQKQKHEPSMPSSQQNTRMDLSQIELIYRAEGNANLVLALPQFKKVLRLPKIQQKQQSKKQQQQNEISLQELQQMNEWKQQPQHQDTQYGQKCPGPNKHQQQQLEQQQQQQEHWDNQKEEQQQQQHEQSELHQQEPTNMTLTTTGQQLLQLPQSSNAVGILTMDHYVAYIGIIRCLLGNEFVFEADIVAVPNPNDRDWINEHIRPYRPVNRLDKEFGGHYGLLLPDATRLPAEFDSLFSNSQQTKSKQQCCCSPADDQDAIAGASNNIFLEDTFAIEIKPKQGWLLPNDVNNLFDIKPTTGVAVQQPTTVATETTAYSLVDVEPVTYTYTSTTSTSKGTLQTSADKECFTATQNKSSITKTTTSPQQQQKSLSAIHEEEAPASGTTVGVLHDEVDIRCRYCSMQFLKLQQQKILQRSNYCPIDLFSGVPARMWNALHALFTCPQNNLRIFKNGIVVFDDQLSRLSKIEDLFPSNQLHILKELLVTCLLKDYNPNGPNIAANANPDIDDNIDDVMATKSRDVQITAKGLAHDNADPQSSPTTPGKKLKTIKAETQPESDVTKVNTTFTTANTTITTTSSSSSIISAATKPNSKMAGTITSSTGTTTTSQQSSDTKNSSLAGFSDSPSHCPTSVGRSDVSVEPKNKPEMLSLPKNCVLQKILNLQLLAKQNFVHMLKENYHKKKGKSYDILSTLLKKFQYQKQKLGISQLSAEEQYQLAATVLDCSIMITFRQVSTKNMPDNGSLNANPRMICINGQHFMTKITLLDLDPKPDTHFAKYVKQTQEIMQSIHMLLEQ
ncbi:inositol-pentakisphosphate 2-kinase [Musca vetustissima]|uniref:inositol-pentakisphosphate 2-kinase n=1 Tax=Musca vetustissima TaxID=27455 RepID=UPI002AB6FC1A|nr:inositol-pentakisphosphate 2-kinase [Musca vetustissima]